MTTVQPFLISTCGSEAEMLSKKQELVFSLNTPGIRPDWALVKEDDQAKARIMTPGKAIKAGAKRIVIGRPITQAEDPREAAEKTLQEIKEAAEEAASEKK